VSKFFLFTDLDDTIISTARKTDFRQKFEVGAFNQEGQPSSYIYKEQKELFETLLPIFKIIPTTARSLESYKRTIFWRDYDLGDAVLNFSGTVLRNGKVDLEWQSQMNENYKKLVSLEELKNSFQNFIQKEMNSRSPVVKNIENFYVNIYNKRFRENPKVSQEVENLVKGFKRENKLDEFYIYKNDASFALLPNFLNKSFGVEYLIEKEKPKLVFGAGDNLTDFDFMSLSDYFIVPKKSQLHKSFKNLKSKF
jgi:hypothetical protein